MLGFKEFRLMQEDVLTEDAFSIFESIESFEQLMEDTPEQASHVIHVLRRGEKGSEYAPRTKGSSMLQGAEYRDEMVKHAKEFGAMSPKEQDKRANEAKKELEASHGIKGHGDLLKANGKLETRAAGSDDPVRVDPKHPVHGGQHGGKAILAKGFTDTPDKIKTSEGYVERCAGSTASCRASCLQKHGQNCIPASIKAKSRVTHALLGLDKTGTTQSHEEATKTRRNYAHLMLHGVKAHIKAAEKIGAAPALRPGYASEALSHLAPEMTKEGLGEKANKKLIYTGYSAVKDVHHKYPGYAASLKGPAIKEKIDPKTGKSEGVHYGDKEMENHGHLHAMLSSLHTKKGDTEDKNAYGVVGLHRTTNPRFVPKEEQEKSEKAVESMHTLRLHHYNEKGEHVGHTDYDTKNGHKEGDVRAVDMPNKGPHSMSPKGEHKGRVMLNTLSGIAKGQTTKHVTVPNKDEPNNPYHIPAHAHNADFTIPIDHLHKGILHVHHPETVAKLSPEEKKRFGENDARFREKNHMDVESKD
jgi:hypothetical protein